ncbi:MAG: hypothetical protein H7A24_00210 [Leptospiraceae bacterium]|nr:hypothetical protein [Leptospiraceae bacterium]MCP5510274.1 hypothetical protein [Leptospiraceae bacterium]
MSKPERKGSRNPKERPDYTFPEEEEVQGTPVELFFINIAKFIEKNRLRVFASVAGIFIVLGGIVAFGEYSRYREELATLEVEKLEKKFTKSPPTDESQKIKEMEDFLKEHSAKNANLRVSKQLIDSYAKKEDYKNAGFYAEKMSGLISEPPEVRAYFHFLAANYYENNKEPELALKQFEKASLLVSSKKDMAVMNAWIYFHTGRLQFDSGKKEEALGNFKKVLELESDHRSYLEQPQQMSTYMILKINKG